MWYRLQRIEDQMRSDYQSLTASLAVERDRRNEAFGRMERAHQALVEAHVGLRESHEETRKGLEETRKGLEETRKGLEETRKAVAGLIASHDGLIASHDRMGRRLEEMGQAQDQLFASFRDVLAGGDAVEELFMRQHQGLQRQVRELAEGMDGWAQTVEQRLESLERRCPPAA